RGILLASQGGVKRAGAALKEAIRLGLVDQEVREKLEACNNLVRIMSEVERSEAQVDEDVAERSPAEQATGLRTRRLYLGNLSNYKVVLEMATLADSMIHVDIGVQNLAYAKVVGIVFTTDNWATVRTAYGTYSSTMMNGLEVWQVAATVGSATEVKFAIFYR